MTLNFIKVLPPELLDITVLNSFIIATDILIFSKQSFLATPCCAALFANTYKHNNKLHVVVFTIKYSDDIIINNMHNTFPLHENLHFVIFTRFAPPKQETFFKDDANHDPQWSDEQILSAKFTFNGLLIGK